jgi:nicotinate-nucleotide adenylyltransferase
MDHAKPEGAQQNAVEPEHVAIFGGSFDPPHVAHVLAAAYALSTGGFDSLLVVPVFAHPFDKPLTAFEHRVAMTRAAMSDLSRVSVSTIERTLDTPSRTLNTVQFLKREHPTYRLRLVLGADVLGDKAKWFGFDELVRLAPPFVLGRHGVVSDEAPPPLLPEVSSTALRSRLRHVQGSREADPELGRLIPRDVLRYIDTHGLYR